MSVCKLLNGHSLNVVCFEGFPVDGRLVHVGEDSIERLGVSSVSVGDGRNADNDKQRETKGDRMKEREILRGPGGMRVELDNREMDKDRNCWGTPAMVYLGNDSATFDWANQMGFLSGDDTFLSQDQVTWLESVEDRVMAWEEYWTEVIGVQF